MRLRPTLLAAAVVATPLAVRAQPLPFISAPYTYAVTGCGSSNSPRALPSVCGRGTAMVGAVVSQFGFLSYQVVLDVALEREPGFTAPFIFEDGFYEYEYLFAPANVLVRGRDTFTLGRVTFSETRLTGSQLLFIGGNHAVPGSVVLTSGLLSIQYPEGPPFFGSAVVSVPFTFTATPEPSTFALGAVGALALAGARARSRRRAT